MKRSSKKSSRKHRLVNGYARRAKYGSSYSLPDKQDVQALEPGDWVKVGVIADASGGADMAWLKILSSDGHGHFTGRSVDAGWPDLERAHFSTKNVLDYATSESMLLSQIGRGALVLGIFAGIWWWTRRRSAAEQIPASTTGP